MEHAVRELQPKQNNIPELIDTPEDVDQLLDALIEAQKRAGSYEGSKEVLAEVQTIFQTKIVDASEEVHDLLLEILAVYQYRILNNLRASDDINKWPMGVFIDAYKVAMLSGIADDEIDSGRALLTLGKKVIMYMNSDNDFQDTDVDIIEATVKALVEYSDHYSSKPEIMNCISDLELSLVQIDSAQDFFDEEQGRLEDGAVVAAQEELRGRYDDILKIITEAIGIEDAAILEDSSYQSTIKEFLLDTWERVMLSMARWELQSEETHKFASIVNTVTTEHPDSLTAHMLMARYILQKGFDDPGMLLSMQNVLIGFIEEEGSRRPELISLMGQICARIGDNAAAMKYLGMLKSDSVFHRELKEALN